MADPKKNPYELTFIVSGVLNDQQTQQAVSKVTGFIEDNGGEIESVDEWGSQRLAYKIDRKRSGYYVTVHFQAPGAMIPRMERAMTINDDILRYLTLRMDAKMLRYHRQRQQRQAEEAAVEQEAEA